MDQLFREEAIEHRRRRLEGEIVLTRSVPLSLVTALLTSITAILTAWAVLGHFSRTETVPGSLTTDGPLAKVFADRPGRLTWLGVKEGDVVVQGRPVATIRTEQDLEGGGSAYEQRLASVSAQSRIVRRQLLLEDQRSGEERNRLVRLMAELGTERAQLASEVELQRQAVVSTRESLDALQGLVRSGFETKTTLEQRRQAWLGASTQLEGLVGQVAQVEERRSEAAAELAKLPGDHAGRVADLNSGLAQLEQKRIDVEGARGFTISAPVAGRVTSVQASVGRSTDGRVPLMAIVPLGSNLQATLYAPSRAVGMAKPGQEVRLMYDAFPYQRFGTFTGRITRISRSVLAPDEVDSPLKLQDPVYEIGVALDRQSVEAYGSALPLQPGMTLTADLVLDRRSFLDWLLEPIRAVGARS